MSPNFFYQSRGVVASISVNLIRRPKDSEFWYPVITLLGFTFPINLVPIEDKDGIMGENAICRADFMVHQLQLRFTNECVTVSFTNQIMRSLMQNRPAC